MARWQQITVVLMVAALVAAGCKKKQEGGEPAPTPAADAATAPTPEQTPDAATPPADVAQAVEAAAEATAEATDATEHEPTFEELVAASKPLTPTITPQKAGDKEITADVCTFEGLELLGESSMNVMNNIAVTSDGKLYVVDNDGQLMRFTFKEGDACVLVYDAAFGTAGKLKLDQEIETLNVDGNNKLYASAGIWESFRLTEGAVDFKCETDPNGYIVPREDGKGGLAYWSRGELVKVAFTDTGCTGENWAFESPLDMVQSVAFMNDLVLVGGSLKPEVNPNHEIVVVAFNKEGKPQFQLGSTAEGIDEQTICWAHGLSACPSGICVLDSNCRAMTTWNDKGEFQAKIDLSELFGLRYPWYPDFQVVGDVTYVAAGQEREESSVAQGFIFRVHGL